MEHAVEALKLAASVIVFVLAVALSYMLFSRTKETADSIFYIRDSHKYMEEENLENIVYITSKDVETNRSVNMETIIPTLYRYHKENFGVTIVVKDPTDTTKYKILARYDNTTESIVGSWVNEYQPDDTDTTANKDLPVINTHINYLNKYVTTGDYEWKAKDLAAVYKTTRNIAGTDNEVHTTPWLNSEQGIAARIGADVSGNAIKFNDIDIYEGVVKNVLGDDPDYKSLLSYSKSEISFKEIIHVIDNNKYVEAVGEAGSSPVLEQRLISKTEIIYIQE